MIIENLFYHDGDWHKQSEDSDLQNVSIVFTFGDTDEFSDPKHYTYLRERYPDANIIGCSSSGNILGPEIHSSNVIATALSFKSASSVLKSVVVSDGDDVIALSEKLASEFPKEGLKHIFLLADGIKIIGTDILKGFNTVLPDVSKSGGMAGDGERLEKTFVVANDVAKQSTIAALGFYGDSLRFGYGSQGGWTPFGTKRIINKSHANTIYELNEEPIIDYYRRYVGDYASSLQNAGFKYPLHIAKDENSIGVIRTLVALDEEKKSITFAGDVPQGYTAQLMKPDLNTLIEGAGDAAKDAKLSSENQAFALTVSCTGRRIVMGIITEEELEILAEELGENTQLMGFYSYGEFAPIKSDSNNCILHNETMTLTVIYED